MSRPADYPASWSWFAGALIVHDGIIGHGRVRRQRHHARTSRRIPIGVIAIVQAALVIAAILTAIVLPEILKKATGTANPTILPLDYAPNLGVFYVGLAAATAVVLVIYAVLARRQKGRPSIAQD